MAQTEDVHSLSPSVTFDSKVEPRIMDSKHPTADELHKLVFHIMPFILCLAVLDVSLTETWVAVLIRFCSRKCLRCI